MPILASFTGVRAFGFNKLSTGPTLPNKLVASTVFGKSIMATYDGVIYRSATDVDVDYISSNNSIVLGTYYGSNTAKISTDGVTWTSVTLPSNYGNTSNTLAGPGMLMVFVSSGSNYHKSTDGVSWSGGTFPISTYFPTGVYGGGKYLVVSSSSSNYMYSTNGTSWTTGTLPITGFYRSVRYINGLYFVLTNSTTTYAYSSNGTSWSTGTFPSDNAWSFIAHGNGTYVVSAASTVGGNVSQHLTSTDGINWTNRTKGFGHGNPVFANGFFWVISNGSPSTLYKSSNGISWTAVATTPYSGDMNNSILINTAD